MLLELFNLFQLKAKQNKKAKTNIMNGVSLIASERDAGVREVSVKWVDYSPDKDRWNLAERSG